MTSTASALTWWNVASTGESRGGWGVGGGEKGLGKRCGKLGVVWEPWNGGRGNSAGEPAHWLVRCPRASSPVTLNTKSPRERTGGEEASKAMLRRPTRCHSDLLSPLCPVGRRPGRRLPTAGPHSHVQPQFVAVMCRALWWEFGPRHQTTAVTTPALRDVGPTPQKCMVSVEDPSQPPWSLSQ